MISPRSTTVSSSVCFRAKATGDAQWVTVLTSDSGVPVPSESFSQIFDPMALLPGRRPELGLAVGRKIIEAAGGGVSAERDHLAGLAIEAKLPRQSWLNVNERASI